MIRLYGVSYWRPHGRGGDVEETTLEAYTAEDAAYQVRRRGPEGTRVLDVQPAPPSSSCACSARHEGPCGPGLAGAQRA